MKPPYHRDPAEQTPIRLPGQRWSRAETAAHVDDLRRARAVGASTRQFAAEAEVPRSSLRYWDERRRTLEGEGVPAFLETAEGLRWLHRLVWAMVFVMTLRCPSGIRAVCEVLELSGLSDVLGSSFGTLQKMVGRLLEVVGEAGEELDTELVERLAGQSPMQITVCEDETFHPGICLVAMEPVSGFILVEQQAERRDAPTWDAVVQEATDRLGVEIIQSTSDQASALKKHARDGLGAHHSPDLFHVQHDLHGATVRPLMARQKAALGGLDQATEELREVVAARDEHQRSKRRPGRPPDFAARIERAELEVALARDRLEQATEDRRQMKEAVNGIGQVYHPYDLTTGAAQSAGKVAELIGEHFGTIDEVARRAGLSAQSLATIEKAWRVVEEMTDTISWTQERISERLAALRLDEAEHALVTGNVLPGLYLQRVASRASTAEQRQALIEVVSDLLGEGQDPAAPLAHIEQLRRKWIIEAVRGCADLFQRSSLCVEGRNGHLRQFKRGAHQLSPQKLKALTVVHNFHVTRADGSTAAERLFGRGHEALFERVLRELPAPPRPARKRRSQRSAQRLQKRAA
jgi:hypothetical protein